MVHLMDATEDFPHDDDDTGDAEAMTALSPAQLEFARDKMRELEKASQKLGLYQQGVNLAVCHTPEGSKLVMFATFLTGDVAWSNRVLDEDAHKVDTEFRSMQSEMEADDFEEYRRRLMEEQGYEEAD